uniref:Uncharacterized protein n=1 Tax=Panagrellus redivivus TaxID=6233 RepID=A0A7E4VQY0_PANRE
MRLYLAAQPPRSRSPDSGKEKLSATTNGNSILASVHGSKQVGIFGQVYLKSPGNLPPASLAGPSPFGRWPSVL